MGDPFSAEFHKAMLGPIARLKEIVRSEDGFDDFGDVVDAIRHVINIFEGRDLEDDGEGSDE